MNKKIIGIFICVLFLLLIVGSNGILSTNSKDKVENPIERVKKIYYPMVKFEWNIHDTKLEWINSGFFKGLFSIDEISYSFTGKDGFEFDISIGFWSKYMVEYGIVNVDPIFRPKIELSSGDIIKWNLIVYNEDMNSEDIWSRYAYGVVIEKVI